MSLPQAHDIEVGELARRLASSEPFVLLDVREPWELERAAIADDRLRNTPMSRLAQSGVASLPAELADRDHLVLVLCHHGVRSAQATSWLRAGGWAKAYNVCGGIAEYASRVDPSVGSY